MDLPLIAILVWLAIGLSGAIYLLRKSSWFAFFGGCTLALYGAFPAILISMVGQTLNNPLLELIGQLLLLFFLSLAVRWSVLHGLSCVGDQDISRHIEHGQCR